jgi:hypothetical protein
MNEVTVRRLNEAGISEFLKINWGKCSQDEGNPPDILLDPKFSEEVIFSNGNTREIDTEATFSNGIEMVEVLRLSIGDRLQPGDTKDVGLWAWLSLAFYDQIRAKDKDGNWKSCAAARMIPSGRTVSYYRHSMSARYFMHSVHGNNSLWILQGPINRWSDLYEQISSTSWIISSTSIIEAVQKLYYDPSLPNGIKKGAAGKMEGSARRLVAVLNQFWETYDLRSMSSDQILDLLPSEFVNFKPLNQEEV